MKLTRVIVLSILCQAVADDFIITTGSECDLPGGEADLLASYSDVSFSQCEDLCSSESNIKDYGCVGFQFYRDGLASILANDSTGRRLESCSDADCDSFSKGNCDNSNHCEWVGAANSGACEMIDSPSSDACTSYNQNSCNNHDCFCTWNGSACVDNVTSTSSPSQVGSNSDAPSSTYSSSQVPSSTSSTSNSISSSTTICEDDGCSSLSLGQCKQSNHCEWSGDSKSGTCTVNESPADDACTLYKKGSCEKAPCFCEWIGNGDGWCQNLPSQVPSIIPSVTPSIIPSLIPSSNPSVLPTVTDSMAPSVEPTQTPSFEPTQTPSVNPTATPSTTPTIAASAAPSISTSQCLLIKRVTFATASSDSSDFVCGVRSNISTAFPTVSPAPSVSKMPSLPPSVSSAPTETITLIPTTEPSTTPSRTPSTTPSSRPTVSDAPSNAPTVPLRSVTIALDMGLDPCDLDNEATTAMQDSLMESLVALLTEYDVEGIQVINDCPGDNSGVFLVLVSARKVYTSRRRLQIFTNLYEAVRLTIEENATEIASNIAASNVALSAISGITVIESPSLQPSFVPSTSPSATPSVLPSFAPSQGKKGKGRKKTKKGKDKKAKNANKVDKKGNKKGN